MNNTLDVDGNMFSTRIKKGVKSNNIFQSIAPWRSIVLWM